LERQEGSRGCCGVFLSLVLQRLPVLSSAVTTPAGAVEEEEEQAEEEEEVVEEEDLFKANIVN